MKNLNQIDCIELTSFEAQQTIGGSETKEVKMWQNLSYYFGLATYGLFVFGTEGGKSAGISVK